MVRSKEVPKKPKDPLLTPPSKPRGFSLREDGGFGGSLPRNRGGAAMSSPAPASVPSYMRATSSSGAKAGKRERQRAGVVPSSPASASPAGQQRRPARVVPRGKVLFPASAAALASSSPGMGRHTCSSTLKEAKFPGALDLAPGSTDAEGPAAMRICPYTYCSLNGHAHAPAVPLRSFLATRRRLIKTQQSMKHKGVSAFRRGQPKPEDKNRVCAGAVAKVAPPLVDEEALGDFFVEVYNGPRVSSGTSCSDMSLDEMDATVRRMEFVVFDRCGADDDDNNNKGNNDLGVNGDGDGEGTPEETPGVCEDSSSECSDAGISGNLVEELPWMRYQGYECDSLDDDASEKQGLIHEEIGEAEASEWQEGNIEEAKPGGSDDEHEEEAGEEQKSDDEEVISDVPRETGIIQEKEGEDCRVDTVYQEGNIEDGKSGGVDDGLVEEADEQKPDDEGVISDLPRETGIVEEEEGEDCRMDTVYQQEDPIGQETQDGSDDVECVSDVANKNEADEHEEMDDQKPDDEEVISDLPRETGIVEEEEDKGCRVNTAHQQEDPTGQETEDPRDDVECASDVSNKMEIVAEQARTICPVEVCKEQGKGDEENILVKVCQGDTCDGQGTSEEELWGGVCKSEIHECEEAERVENVLEVSCEEENSADQEAKDDQTNMDSASKLETAEREKDGESEMEIPGTVPDVVAEDIFQQESTTEALSEGEISNSSAIGYPDDESSNQPTNIGFEQDVNTVEDAFEQDVSTVEDAFEQDVSTGEDAFEQDVNTVEYASEQLDTTSENTVSGTEDAQLEITTRKSEEPATTQESIHDFNSECADAPAKMEPEITEVEPEESSEDSSIPQESSQSDQYAHDDNGAQVEVCVDVPAQMEAEITECKLEDSSDESANPQESSQSDKSAHVNNGAETEQEFTSCKSKDPSEECGTAQEVAHDDNSAYLAEGAQMQLGHVTSKLEDTSEECGIAQEISEDENSAYVSDDTQNVSEITTSKLADASESSIAQEIGEDEKSAYVSDDAQDGSEVNACDLDDVSESVRDQEIGEDEKSAYVSDDAQDGSEINACDLDDVSESVRDQEADQDHNCADVSDGAQNESELTLSELSNASEGSDFTQEAVRDDNIIEVNDGPRQESETMASESELAHEELDITQIGHEDDYPAGALKDTRVTRGTKDTCEEVCITEEANLSPVVQILHHNGDLSPTDGNGEPQSLPAADNNGELQSLPAEVTDSKEFSVDDMCSVFSGMNLKGDVYVDPAESEISPRKRLIIAGRRRTLEEEERMRGFNPRGPNFLPLELDPDSEKVDLKHQTAEDRKNAEEWMIDYALRRAVNNLGGRKKKVELLVRAFETVLPHDEDKKKNSTPTRPVQACS